MGGVTKGVRGTAEAVSGRLGSTPPPIPPNRITTPAPEPKSKANESVDRSAVFKCVCCANPQKGESEKGSVNIIVFLIEPCTAMRCNAMHAHRPKPPVQRQPPTQKYPLKRAGRNKPGHVPRPSTRAEPDIRIRTECAGVT